MRKRAHSYTWLLKYLTKAMMRSVTSGHVELSSIRFFPAGSLSKLRMKLPWDKSCSRVNLTWHLATGRTSARTLRIWSQECSRSNQMKGSVQKKQLTMSGSNASNNLMGNLKWSFRVLLLTFAIFLPRHWKRYRSIAFSQVRCSQRMSWLLSLMFLKLLMRETVHSLMRKHSQASRST